jgi:DivIVA domain-containing protein
MAGRRKDKKKRDKDEGLFADQAGPHRITPLDIQQKEFRLKMRGYHERDVDEFLDEVTEEVARLYAENKRLHEDLDSKGTVRFGTGGLSDEADVIIRQARDEAARIVREAESYSARLAATTPAGGRSLARPSGTPLPSSGVTGAALAGFLSREKSFLQNLAKMMQDHANAMKEDVRRVRDASRREASAIASEPTPAPQSDLRYRAEPEPERPEPVREAEEQPSHELWRPSPAGTAEEAERPVSEPEWRTDMDTESSPEAGGPPSFIDEPPRRPDATPVPSGETPEESGPAERYSEYVDEPTQAWSPEPEQEEPARTPQERRATERTEERRATERPEEGDASASQVDAPAARWTPRTEQESAERERSLKELFWGED